MVRGEHESNSLFLSVFLSQPISKQRNKESYVGEDEREATRSGGVESVSVLLVASMPLGLYTTSNDNTFLRSLSGHYCRPLKIPSQHLFGK